MAFFDLPLEQLKTFRLDEPEPADFDAFWSATLAETAEHPLDATYEPVGDDFYKLVDCYDATFRGFGGHAIRAWFMEPAGNMRKLPCVVKYIGYSGGRSQPFEHLDWPVDGYCSLVMDTRGQGLDVWGGTDDPVGTGPAEFGWMTRGIRSPQTYYYRRVFTDAARAVEAAASHPHVDATRIAVTGGSQGGGISIAAAGLCGEKVKLCMPDVPFLCGYRRATSLVDTAPYSEISRYLNLHRDRVEQVFATLAYFDGVHLAARIRARCLFSAAQMDTICPPSTVFAAYNRVPSEKDIRVYAYNGHEGGACVHAQAKHRYAAEHL